MRVVACGSGGRGALCSRPAARALLSRPSRFSALVPPRALLVFGAGARSRTFVCKRLRRATALCVWLLAVQAAAVRSTRIPPRALCSRVPPGALPSSLHTRCQCFGPVHEHARSCASGCAGRDAMMQLPTAKTAMQTCRESTPPGPLLFLGPFTFISCLTRHNKHTHEDTYRENIQRFQWHSPWLQWRSQWSTTTTAGSSPCIM